MKITDLDLTFEVVPTAEEYVQNGNSVDLKPDGEKIPVTEANRMEYCRLFTEYRLIGEIRDQVIFVSQLSYCHDGLTIHFSFPMGVHLVGWWVGCSSYM